MSDQNVCVEATHLMHMATDAHVFSTIEEVNDILGKLKKHLDFALKNGLYSSYGDALFVNETGTEIAYLRVILGKISLKGKIRIFGLHEFIDPFDDIATLCDPYINGEGGLVIPIILLAEIQKRIDVMISRYHHPATQRRLFRKSSRWWFRRSDRKA